jgi:hypothetical protein
MLRITLKHLMVKIAIVVLFSASTPVHAFMDQFLDPKDGALDMSQWLVERKGFLPIPLFISDPAVGYGLGAGLAFFHKSDEDIEKNKQANEDDMLSLPPSISFAAGVYTENESWLLGGGHFGSWKNDNIRYLGAVGGADINLKFYGLEDDSSLDNNPLEFNIEGLFFLQDIKFRINESKFFLGARYIFLNADVKIDGLENPDDSPETPSEDMDAVKDSGIALTAGYDSRDNIFSTSRGHELQLQITRYDQAIGGDFDYTTTKVATHSWWQLLSNVVLGLRLDGRFVDGEAPFWGVPFIQMRGIPSLRYQGENVFVAETEPRWDVTDRWSVVGFAGIGWTAEEIYELGDDEAEVAYGLGFRYLLARRMGLRLGLDVARGPEDTVVYISFGNAWK